MSSLAAFLSNRKQFAFVGCTHHRTRWYNQETTFRLLKIRLEGRTTKLVPGCSTRYCTSRSPLSEKAI